MTLKLENVFFDTETTDINPGQIASLSYIIEGIEGVKEAGNIFFKVDSMQPGAQKVHGFSIEQLAELSGGLAFKDRCREVHDLVADKRLIAHNVAFDIKFLSSELWRCGVSYQPLDKLCTMEYFTDILKFPAYNRKHGKYKYPKLTEIVNYYELDPRLIQEYAKELFGVTNENIGYHDSRFDTAAMYVATNVHRDELVGKVNWANTFRLQPKLF